MTNAEFAERCAFLRAVPAHPAGAVTPSEVEEFRDARDVAAKLVARATDDAVSRYWRTQAGCLLVVVEAVVLPKSRLM